MVLCCHHLKAMATELWSPGASELQNRKDKREFWRGGVV